MPESKVNNIISHDYILLYVLHHQLQLQDVIEWIQIQNAFDEEYALALAIHLMNPKKYKPRV